MPVIKGSGTCVSVTIASWQKYALCELVFEILSWRLLVEVLVSVSIVGSQCAYERPGLHRRCLCHGSRGIGCVHEVLLLLLLLVLSVDVITEEVLQAATDADHGGDEVG